MTVEPANVVGQGSPDGHGSPVGHGLEPTDGPLTDEELQLAFRNRGMPLEAMRYDITPSGLHYLVIHWDIPDAEAASWKVAIGGRVRRPVELSLASIMERPAQTLRVTLECAGNGRSRLSPRPLSVPWLFEAIGTADWTGTSVWPILEEAGLAEGAVEVAFHGTDHGIQGGEEQDYGRSLTLDDVRRPEVILAWAMNGRPLEPQHGFPLRLIVPGWYGMTSVKWLSSIEVLAQPYQGFQQAVAYRYQADADDPGQPVSRIRVRSLMIPPGEPDFFTRTRTLDAGTVRLAGRAWSGEGPLERVEVAVDGQWRGATLEPAAGEFAWRRWWFDWDATPGDHELACRATDATGATQPLDQPWNYQGMGNNIVQRLTVTVR